MAERYFTAAEVEALIPRLTELMGVVMRAHEEAGERRETLRAERDRVAMSGGAVVDRDAWRAHTEALERLAGGIQHSLEEVTRLGGEPKDLTLGLVDFLHLRQGQPVNLCWKHGEREVRFWHGLREGYGGRQPL